MERCEQCKWEESCSRAALRPLGATRDDPRAAQAAPRQPMCIPAVASVLEARTAATPRGTSTTMAQRCASPRDISRLRRWHLQRGGGRGRRCPPLDETGEGRRRGAWLPALPRACQATVSRALRAERAHVLRRDVPASQSGGGGGSARFVSETWMGMAVARGIDVPVVCHGTDSSSPRRASHRCRCRSAKCVPLLLAGGQDGELAPSPVRVVGGRRAARDGAEAAQGLAPIFSCARKPCTSALPL